LSITLGVCPQELKAIRRSDEIKSVEIFVISRMSVLSCSQRSRLAAVLAFEKQSARQPKPIRITYE
jgi:hypothetical protein